MNITTKYTNVNGTPKVVARTTGKQKTTNWDLSKSTDWNHGTAAGALLEAMTKHDLREDKRELLARVDKATHTSSDDGTRHTFTL